MGRPVRALPTRFHRPGSGNGLAGIIGSTCTLAVESEFRTDIRHSDVHPARTSCSPAATQPKPLPSNTIVCAGQNVLWHEPCNKDGGLRGEV